MVKHLVRTALLVSLVAGTAHAGPIGVQQPYFTYSPGAVDFEDIQWTPLEFAAFSAYGGYFANVRRPRFETPLPEFFFPESDLGIEDEVVISPLSSIVPTFSPGQVNFSAMSLAAASEPEDEGGAPVPEPGALALVGAGLLAASRTLRRRFAR